MKKKLIWLAVGMVFFVVSSREIHAQWVQTNGPNGGSIFALAVSGSNIFAGTWGAGVWRRPISEMIGVINPYSKNRLAQDNYRIHFQKHENSIAIIGFSLPHSDQVSINVYTLSGRKIASLVNEKLGPGSYESPWDTRNMAAGNYIVRMQAGSDIYSAHIPFCR
jgi:hypothetical protein